MNEQRDIYLYGVIYEFLMKTYSKNPQWQFREVQEGGCYWVNTEKGEI